MKRKIIFFVYQLLLVHSIFAVKLCFPEKYNKYEEIFTSTFNDMVSEDIGLEYGYYQTMEDYVKSFSLYKCDVAMIEPPLYDLHFNDSVLPIYANISEIIKTRRADPDPEDAKTFSLLLKDLEVIDKDNNVAHALPMFLDFGILYYRDDKDEKPPETWYDLKPIEEYKESEEFSVANTIYIGQFNEYREFFYNLFENVLNAYDPLSDKELTYETVQREVNVTISHFKRLFDYEIIDEYAWHLNSEYGVIRFNDEKALFMRNWSSFLHNVTVTYERKRNGGDKPSFKISEMLYNVSPHTPKSRAINKGIYLCVAKSSEEPEKALVVLETFTSKPFLQSLISKDEFYDIPAYTSLLKSENEYNNKKYCERINCDFFNGLIEDCIINTYSIFYQDSFLNKLSEFFEKAKIYFKESGTGRPDEESDSEDKEYVTLSFLMNKFSDLFQDKYVELKSATTIIMIIIVAFEIIITSIVTYYLVKHRNFIDIRRSSPLFLITMLVGIILAFCSILTFIGKPTNFICIFRPYILVLAFGLTFFSLLLKTFRIKVIFDKVNIQVKDSNLILYLCVLLGFQLILVTIWSIIDPMKPNVKRNGMEMHYYVCQNTNLHSNFGKYIQNSLIVINGLTLVYGCYLAYKVKNVYSEYNESKVIGLSIYGIVICMIILMFIVNISGLDHTTLFLIQSLMIILSADIILVFMFTPKLWKLHINIISEIPVDKPAPISTDKKDMDQDNNVSLKNNNVDENEEN